MLLHRMMGRILAPGGNVDFETVSFRCILQPSFDVLPASDYMRDVFLEKPSD